MASLTAEELEKLTEVAFEVLIEPRTKGTGWLVDTAACVNHEAHAAATTSSRAVPGSTLPAVRTRARDRRTKMPRSRRKIGARTTRSGFPDLRGMEKTEFASREGGGITRADRRRLVGR